MAGAFPTSVTTYTNPGPTDTTATEIGTRTHDEFHSDNNDDLEQVMTKLGTGASTASANTVLRGTGSGATAYGQIQTADIATSQITSALIADDTIVNADVNSAAAILVSKLAAGGTANRVVATSNGTTMAMQQVATAMLATNAVTNAQLLFTSGTTTTSSTSFVDLFPSDLSVSYASSGGMLIAFLVAVVQNDTAGQQTYLGVSINGVDWSGTSFQSTNANSFGTAVAMGMETPAAGSIAIKARWGRSSSGQSLATGANTKMLIVELKK